MKKISILILGILLMFAFVGCDDDDNIVLIDPPPAAPQGVYSITGDGEVLIAWYGPYEADLDHYFVLRSLDPVDNYVKIGEVDAESNPNLDLIDYDYVDRDVVNGQTYYYAVMSVDLGGKESDLSAEPVYDTPRPEGIVSLFNSDVLPGSAGFIFALEAIVDTSVADISVVTLFGVPHLQLGSGLTWIQDMGWTDSFMEISVSPPFDDSQDPPVGWSQFNEVELIQMHTYVIYLSATNNFAKVRARSVFATGAELEWGFQVDKGNRELKPVVPGQ